MERSEAALREHGVARIHQLVLAADPGAHALLAARAYREVRRFWEMTIELGDELLAAPRLPEGLTIEPFSAGAARAFHAALEEAFQDHWEHSPESFEDWWERQTRKHDHDPSLWFLVRDGDEVAAATRNDPNRNGGGWIGALGVRRGWRGRGLARALLLHSFREFHARGLRRVGLGVDAANPTGATHLYESVGMHVEVEHVVWEKAVDVSLLRARCPDCRTLTAVAVDDGYECHTCGRTFGAGLVRVPRAWGDGGEAMVEAAALPLAYPEVAVVEEDTLAMQTLAVASDLPARPLVLGGCCCAHVGAVEGLAARHDRVSVLWLDAHGDLNTPESSPSGNEWGMPLRMLLDRGTIDVADVALWGARNLDPPEQEFIAAAGIGDDVDSLLDRAGAVYVALDCDVLDPGELAVFMPEPGGPSLAELDRFLRRVGASGKLVGLGFTGLAPDPANVAGLEQLATALGY